MKALELIKKKLSKLLDMASNSPAPTIPTPLILASSRRSGLSAIKSTYNVLARKKELNLPVGDYEDGSPNENDLIINIIFEEMYRALHEDAVLPVAINIGTQVQASGANVGGPVACLGTTISIGSGNAIIQ